MTADPRPDSPVQRVIAWLRAGYPQGVPPQDYVALLGILGRSLTADELAQVVEEMLHDLDTGAATPTRAEVAGRIRDVPKGPVSDADLHRASAHLAAGGWPLASVALAESSGTGVVDRAVTWLRGGYPQSLPDQDYLSLFAFLERRLSESEVRDVADRLEALGLVPPDRIDVAVEISRVTSELPSETDIDRVRRELGDAAS